MKNKGDNSIAEVSAHLKDVLDRLRSPERNDVTVNDPVVPSRRYCGKCEYGWVMESGRAKRCPCQKPANVGMRQEWVDALLEKYRAGLPKKLKNVSVMTFLVRPGHEHLKPALDKYLRDLKAGKKYGFFIFGGTAVGKSYAAAYVVNSVRHQKIMTSAMVNFSRILTALRMTFKYEDDHQGLLSVLYDTPLLAIDDLGMEQRVAENPELSWSVAEFYKVIDYRRDEELPTIVTSNRTVEELRDRLGEPIMSRIQSMTLRIPMEPPGTA